MSEDATRYDTIAAAEAALTQAGFKRDVQSAMWVSGNDRAKVIRDSGDGKFLISRR